MGEAVRTETGGARGRGILKYYERGAVGGVENISDDEMETDESGKDSEGGARTV